MFRPGVSTLRRCLIRPTHIATQTRHISKIEVSNPVGIFFLRQSRSVLKAILWFYGSAAVIGITGYFGSKWYIDKYQLMAKEWPIEAKVAGRAGVYFQEISENDHNAELALIYALKSIGEEEGLKIESEDNKKFQLLNLEQLEKKSKKWKAMYIDLVTRLALCKAELGDLDNAWKLCHYSINLPMDLGSRELKSKALRLAARLDRQKGELKRSESYLLDAVRFNELLETGIVFQDSGSYLLDKESKCTPELFESLLELGVTYTQLEEYTKSLEIFLNLLQVSESNEADIRHSNQALLKNYVGEILYKKGLTKKAIEWCRAAFKESHTFAVSDVKSAYITKQALRNLVSLYKKTGDDDLAQEAQTTLDNIVVPLSNISSTFLLEKLFR